MTKPHITKAFQDAANIEADTPITAGSDLGNPSKTRTIVIPMKGIIADLYAWIGKHRDKLDAAGDPMCSDLIELLKKYEYTQEKLDIALTALKNVVTGNEGLAFHYAKTALNDIKTLQKEEQS